MNIELRMMNFEIQVYFILNDFGNLQYHSRG